MWIFSLSLCTTEAPSGARKGLYAVRDGMDFHPDDEDLSSGAPVCALKMDCAAGVSMGMQFFALQTGHPAYLDAMRQME